MPQKNKPRKSVNHVIKNSKEIIKEIEITELEDGSAVVTILFRNSCLAAEYALKSRFLDGKCQPNYVIGEIKFDSNLHKQLHQSLRSFDQNGEPTPHYHIRIKTIEMAQTFLSDLKFYQEHNVFTEDRAKISNYMILNPLAFFTQKIEPESCLTDDLIKSKEIDRMLRICNFTTDIMPNKAIDSPRDCTDAYLSPAFYAVHGILWLMIAIAIRDLVSKIFFRNHQPEQQPKDKRPPGRH